MIGSRDVLAHERLCLQQLTHFVASLVLMVTLIAAEGGLAKFGKVTDFPDLQERRKGGFVAPLLRTIESWFRVEREGRRKRGLKLTETAEREGHDELRGVTGNGYLPGRFSQGFN